MNYIPLHIYTCYSFLSSCLKINDLIDIAKKYSFSALGITDLDNTYAYTRFDKACLDNNIKPIYGITLTIKGKTNDFPICVYVQNEVGYHSLCYLVSKKDELTIDIINSHSNGLILVLPCYENKVIYEAFKNNLFNEQMHKYIYSLQKGFSSFYLGIEIYDKESKEVMKKIKEYASNYTFKTIAFPKHLYLTKHSALTLSLLQAIKLDQKIEYKDKLDGPYYFLSELAVSTLYSKEDIASTKELVDSVNFTFNIKRGKLLTYSSKSSIDKRKLILFKCNEIMSLRGSTLDKKYMDRLDYELNIIETMGYLDYFLIVSDYVNEAKSRGILVGPGRGSAVGSLVAYCLGITEVDPLKYDLLFERFLNPERVTLPDIDVDFEDERRNEVIDYIVKKYGSSRIAYISTFQSIGAKKAIRDIGRIISFNPSDISTLANACKSSSLTLDENRKKHPEFDRLCKDEYFNKLYNLAKLIEGFPRQSGVHPAGIILNDEPLENIVPCKIENNNAICEFEAPYLEEQGFLKMDILSLINLTIIKNILNRIKRSNTNLNLNSIPLDDKKTFLSLNAGLTYGVFQLEDQGITQSLKQIKVDSFKDIIAIISLYRPGPMAFIETYARNKVSEKITYIDPSLEDILKPTYGVIIYQEQIMQISQKVASFSLGEADLLRRAISKKDESKMLKLKDKFIKGALKNNYSLEVSNKIYDMIEKFADYGFNKSHSVAYALISYQMAYLKSNYPYEFYTCLLDNKSLLENYAKYLNEFSLFDIKLQNPNINYSLGLNYDYKFNNIYMPFSSIKGINLDICKAIEYERKQNGNYKSFSDFISRIKDYNVQKKEIDQLISAGCFDIFKETRATLHSSLETLLNYHIYSSLDNLSEEDKLSLEPTLIQVEENNEEKCQKEIEALGILLSDSLFSKYKDKLSKYTIINISELLMKKQDSTIVLIIDNIKEFMTKNKKTLVHILGHDDTSSIDVTVFSEEYDLYKAYIEKKKPIIIKLNIQNSDKYGLSYIAKEITPLEVK